MILRQMTMSDADFMLELKNYPETRQFAIATHNEIKKEDHVEWLSRNVKYFQIIESNEMMIGAVRIQDNEISIWIDRKFWGKGFATLAVKEVSKLTMTAKIVEGNLASMKVFIKAGFVPSFYQKPYYIFVKTQR